MDVDAVYFHAVLHTDQEIALAVDDTGFHQVAAFAIDMDSDIRRFHFDLFRVHNIAGAEACLLYTSSGTICDDSYIRLYQEAGYEPNIIYYTDDIDSILMMVAAEEGISVMPTYITRKLYHTEGIVCVPLRGEQEYAAILAVWKADRANQRLQEFKEYLHR